MRKRLKKKKHSCALCKPNKMGCANRWRDKEMVLLKELIAFLKKKKKNWRRLRVYILKYGHR